MPKISDDRRAERRRQIATAALHCFVRNGFDATSMADIIAEAGLSTGAVYVHFENKQDLIRQVIRDVLEERSGEFAELGLRRPLPHPATVLRENLASLRSHPDKAALLLHVWSACAREPSLGALLEELSGELRRLFQGFLEAWLTESGMDEAAASERSALLVQLVLGLRQGFVTQLALVPGFDADAYLRALDLIDFGAGAG